MSRHDTPSLEGEAQVQQESWDKASVAESQTDYAVGQLQISKQQSLFIQVQLQWCLAESMFNYSMRPSLG